MAIRANIPDHELPLWMQQAKRGFDWGMVIVLALSIAIGWALIVYEDLPQTNDSERYVFRTADTAEAFQEGRLYPRWSPHVLQGYGAPIPHYVPPATTYIAGLFEILFTNNPVTSVRLLYLFSFCIAGLSVYKFVQRHSDARSGIFTSVLYLYSPHVGLTVPHILGDLPQAMAIALLPFLLWITSRLIQNQQPLTLLQWIILLTLLILTHPQLALFAGIISVSFALWVTKELRILVVFIVGIVSSIAITSFYWLPAFAEHSLVRWQESPVQPFRHHLQLTQLLKPLQQIDTLFYKQLPQFTLGITLTLFMISSIIALIYSKSKWGFHVFFVSVGLLLMLVSIFLLQAKTWLLTPITLCFAIFGSGIILPLHQTSRRTQRLLFAFLLVIVIVLSLPVWLSPIPHESFGDWDADTQIRFEQQGFGIAVLPDSKHLPTTLSTDTLPSRYLLSTYEDNRINRLETSQISVQTQISLLNTESHGSYYEIQNNGRRQLELLIAYFPGWTATLGNEAIPIRAENENGLAQITLPTTRNVALSVELHSTPIRAIAWGISTITLVVYVLVTVIRSRNASEKPYAPINILDIGSVRLVSVVVVSFIGILLTTQINSLPVSIRAAGGHTLEQAIPLRNRTDVGMEALAIKLDTTTYQPNETITFTIFWQTTRFLPDNYQIRAFIRTPNQSLNWFRTPFHHIGRLPTRRWQRNLIVPDRHQIQLDGNVPSGEYQIAIEIFRCNPNCESSSPLNFFDQQGQFISNQLTLPPIITITN